MPRPADAAVAISRLITTVTHDIHTNGGETFEETRNFGQSLELMAVMAYVLITTADGEPRNATQISKAIDIPRSSVQRHLKTLAASGRLRAVGNVYVADLDFYDRLVTTERLNDWLDSVKSASTELHRLRALFL